MVELMHLIALTLLRGRVGRGKGQDVIMYMVFLYGKCGDK